MKIILILLLLITALSMTLKAQNMDKPPNRQGLENVYGRILMTSSEALRAFETSFNLYIKDGFTLTNNDSIPFGFLSSRITLINRGASADTLFYDFGGVNKNSYLVGGGNESITFRQGRTYIKLRGNNANRAYQLIVE